ncbi:hypothetical protein [Streptomyces boninensis]|uniref:hypothetical protein n=1 Tax=Streptomyces boninensis TaxID=2039455 RepID=UPI003B227B78
MSRSTIPGAIAAVAAASLLLSACGGSDGGGSKDDKIDGADSSPSKSASATPGKDDGRPKVSLPAYAQTKFEGLSTGDAENDEILADTSRSITATYAAILGGETSSPAVSYYNRGKALAGAHSFIKGWVDKKDKWAGVISYYDWKVTPLSKGKVSVIYCSDESKAWITKNPEKKRESLPPASDDSLVLYNERVVKGEQGAWVAEGRLAKRGAKECRR